MEPVEPEPETESGEPGPTPEPEPGTGAQPFIVLERLPMPVGGLALIRQRLSYPESARRLRIQGRVVVNVFVDEKGQVTATEILQSPGFGALERAAVEAILTVEWLPALQRQRPVAVWVAVPVVFRLR